MKDVTITMVKSEEGRYRVIVNDDTGTDENAAGSKGNNSFFTFDNKDDVKKKLDEIFNQLE